MFTNYLSQTYVKTYPSSSLYSRRIESAPITFPFSNDQHKPGSENIRQLSDHENPDVMTIAPWRKKALAVLPVVTLSTVFLKFYAGYLQWHISQEYGRMIGMPRGQILMWLMVVLEILLAAPNILLPISRLRNLSWQWRPRLRMVGETVPSIDVIITTCNEDIDIILDTVRATLELDYPKRRYRVIVTDDGSSSELRSLISKMGLVNPNLYYTARIKTGPDGYKAGNLNHALRFLEALPEGAAEFVAGLDADMIPEKWWLRAMVPHIVLDERVGLACPPQHFYNQPTNDPLLQSRRVCRRVLEVTRDMVGSARCTGSGWLIRRQALEEIGGFATTSLLEDIYSSTLLMAAGWRTVYVPEALQYGLLPDTFYGHIKQLTRWHIGGWQMLNQLRLCITKSRAKKLTWQQRIVAADHQVFLIAAPLMTLFLIMAPYMLLFTDSQFFYYQHIGQLKQMLRVRCLIMIMDWARYVNMSIIAGYQATVRDVCGEIWMSAFYTVSIVRSFILPTSLGGKLAAFTPTGSIPNILNERQKRKRTPLSLRLKVILIDCGAIFHVLLVILTCLGLSKRVLKSLHTHGNDPRALYLNLLVTVAWPPVTWFQHMSACLTPLKYALFPPNVKDREGLLSRDAGSGVAYPTAAARKAVWTMKGCGYAQGHFLLVVYAFGVFVSTWYI